MIERSLRQARRFFDAETRRLFANTATLQTGVVAVLPLSILQSIVLARALGPAGLGAIAPVIALVRVANQICDLGPAQLIVVFSPRYRLVANDERFPALVKLTALISLGCGLLAATVSAVVLLTLGATGWSAQKFVAPALYLAGAAVVADISGLVQTILAANQRFVAATFVRVGSVILSLGVISGTAFLTRDASAVIVAYAAADVLIAFASWGFLMAVSSRDEIAGAHFASIPSLSSHWPEMRRYLRLSWLSSTTMAGLSRADEFIASFVASPEAIGLYKIAKNAFQIVKSLAGPLFQAAFVEIAAYWAQESHQKIRIAIRNMVLGGSALAGGAGLAIVLLGEPVIQWLYGPRFIGAFQLAEILAIAMWGLPFLWVDPLLRVTNRFHVLVSLEAVATITAITVMFAAGRGWGISGIALGTVSFELMFAIIGVLYVAYNRGLLLGQPIATNPVVHSSHHPALLVPIVFPRNAE